MMAVDGAAQLLTVSASRPMADATSTPMMKQYLAMRRELPEDVLLFFGSAIFTSCSSKTPRPPHPSSTSP
jgi:hypothetical protein